MNNNLPNRTKRIALIISGATDSLIGAIVLLIGFGLMPVDIADYGLPSWLVVLVGAFLFIMGAWMAVYNYSRLDE